MGAGEFDACTLPALRSRRLESCPTFGEVQRPPSSWAVLPAQDTPCHQMWGLRADEAQTRRALSKLRAGCQAVGVVLGKAPSGDTGAA